MLPTILIKAVHVLDDPAYNLVLHSSPIQDNTNDYYHWHLEIMPKLTKTAGFEWGTGFYINPTPPEEAARFLREASVEQKDKDLVIGQVGNWVIEELPSRDDSSLAEDPARPP